VRAKFEKLWAAWNESKLTPGESMFKTLGWKKEKEVERMNKSKEKVAQQQRQSMSTAATGGTMGAMTSEGGGGGSP
jgi:hypothetical protein